MVVNFGSFSISRPKGVLLINMSTNRFVLIDYDYDYYGYGEYRGGYCDPYYDDYYRYDEYFYDFPPPPPPARGTRSRQALLVGA